MKHGIPVREISTKAAQRINASYLDKHSKHYTSVQPKTGDGNKRRRLVKKKQKVKEKIHMQEYNLDKRDMKEVTRASTRALWTASHNLSSMT